MKVRIRENSIRLRLTQSEVAQLSAEGRVENTTSFGYVDLKYAVSAARSSEPLSADLRNNVITISVPTDIVAEWAGSERVGMEGVQEVPNGELHILIEKDFACLKSRIGEDDRDTFANPLAAGNQ